MTRWRHDRGFTLVEVVMSVVLGSIIAGVTVAVMITSLNVVDSTRDLSRDSTDTGLVATFLYRDAQAAGGTDPVTLRSDATLGVSASDWNGCQQPGGSLVVRFAWVDRTDASASHPMTTTWALFGDGRLVRRACQDDARVDVAVGEHVADAAASCLPGPACDASTTEVRMQLTGSAVSASPTVTLTASLRTDLASASPAPSSTGPPSPLVVVGADTPACPEMTLGTARTVVIGAALVDGGCGAGAISGDVTRLQPSGGLNVVTGVRDPYAAVVPAVGGCPGLGAAPAGATVYTAPFTATGTTVLAAGHHIFCAGLAVAQGATLTGTDVLLQVVSGDAVFDPDSTVDLSASTTGSTPNLLLTVAGGALSLAGGPSPDILRGIVVAPAARVDLQSDASVAIGALVADRVTTAGGGVIRIGTPIPTLTLAPTTMPTGQVGVAYTATAMTATGGAGPYSWQATGLPAGLTLSSGGLLTGTPATAGPATATLTAIDSTGVAAVTTRSFTIRAALQFAGPASLPAGQTGTAYTTTTATVTGGSTPYAFSATGLPTGLTISTSGTISGSPSAIGDFTVTVTATDAVGATASRVYTVAVRSALAIAAPATLSNGTAGTPWAATTVTAAGGVGPYLFSATGLPPGLSITGAGVISGTPTTAGTSSVTVTVTDGAATVATRAYSVTVSAATSTSAKPFAVLRGFQVFVEGTTSLDTYEIEGAVATGGNLTSRNYLRITHSETSQLTVHQGGQPLGLLVGGRIDLAASGTGSELSLDRGWFVVGSVPGQSFLRFSGDLHLVPTGVTNDYTTPRVLSQNEQADLATSEAVKPGIFDFAGAFATLRTVSSRIGGLTPTACPAVTAPTVSGSGSGQNYSINLRSGGVNVWNVTIADVDRIRYLDSNVSPGGSTKLIINVTDAGAVTLPVRWWNLMKGSGIASSVIWNFPNATSVTVSSSFVGSLLAPNAAVTVYDVNIEGDVVAASLDYRPWSTKIAHYDTAIPCIG
jgi:choice-of-anchor A domain-containing protein/prepilin-type N-terminal cleavage/methylation domain-containing protein